MDLCPEVIPRVCIENIDLKSCRSQITFHPDTAEEHLVCCVCHLVARGSRVLWLLSLHTVGRDLLKDQLPGYGSGISLCKRPLCSARRISRLLSPQDHVAIACSHAGGELSQVIFTDQQIERCPQVLSRRFIIGSQPLTGSSKLSLNKLDVCLSQLASKFG